MTHKLLNGNLLSAIIQNDIKQKVVEQQDSGLRAPGLGVILVGDNPASKSYIKRKEKVAQDQCGFKTFDLKLPADCAKSELTAAINSFNKDREIDGILLQLPLPKGFDSNEFIDQILPTKDADGLHPFNQGLTLRSDSAAINPCTPLGCLAMIDFAYSEYSQESPPESFSLIPAADLSGKNAVIIGRSILVGKPLHSLLLSRNATVTQVHSRTANIAEICAQADILIAAVGVEHLVKADWVRPDAVVIDVGINRTDSGKLTGDVDFNNVKDTSQAITPVPGGVGPMTVAMLMQNTYQLYLNNYVKNSAL